MKRSRLTAGSPASTFEIRDWLEPRRAARRPCEIFPAARRRRRPRARAALMSRTWASYRRAGRGFFRVFIEEPPSGPIMSELTYGCVIVSYLHRDLSA